KGVPLASIYSDGFADAGAAGAERQQKLTKRAKELGVRFIGPNSMGVIDVPGKLSLSVNAVLEMDELPAGGTSIVSQSGTMLGTLVGVRKPPDLARPGRVAVVTPTGGGAATVLDGLGTLGVELASMNDLTMAATPDNYRAKLDELMESPDCDAVLAAVGSSAQFHPQLAVEPIVRIRKQHKPLAAFFTPHAERSLALCAEYGIAAFRTPEACADALAAYLHWKAPRVRPAL